MSRRARKGNLKGGNNGNKQLISRRVSFDPLALLLDASLEGELELVVRTAGQVRDPSAANDEGITALHNAICAGHLDIVRFLVQFGCDVNAQDSDGWLVYTMLIIRFIINLVYIMIITLFFSIYSNLIYEIACFMKQSKINQFMN